MTVSGRYYLLLDEVQESTAWEKAVNSLPEYAGTDIYVTGPNSESIAAMLENIVYFELRRRGYEVYIGKNKRLRSSSAG